MPLGSKMNLGKMGKKTRSSARLNLLLDDEVVRLKAESHTIRIVTPHSPFLSRTAIAIAV